VGFLTSAWHATVPIVWLDETATITSASRTLPQLFFQATHIDAVHTFYYVIMHFVFAVFGYSPLSMRLPSAIAVGVAAAVTVLLARQFGNERRAIVAGLIFCILPRVTWAGGEGRGYAATALLAVTLTLVLVIASRSPLRRWWVVYGVLTVISCIFFAFLVFVLAAHAISMAWWLIRDRPAARARILRWLIAAVAASILVLPFAKLVASEKGEVSWIGGFGLSLTPQIVTDQWFSHVTVWPSHILFALAVIGAVVGLWKLRGFSLGSIIFPAAFFPTFGLIVATIIGVHIYNPRYLTMCTPFVAILIATAITVRIPWRPVLAGILAVLAISLAPAYLSQRTTYALNPENIKGAAAYMERQRAEHIPASRMAIIWGHAQDTRDRNQEIMQWPYPAATRGMIDVTLDKTGAQIGELWDSRRPLADSLGRLSNARVAYYIGSKVPNGAENIQASMALAGFHPTSSWISHSIQIVKFTRQG
jgi:mannosyltransferase